MLRRCLCTSRRSRTLLGPFRQEPVASLSHSVNARRAAARAGLRCSRLSAYAREMKPRHELPASRMLTMILHQDGDHQLMERGPSPLL
jgi:hypothetical protein